MGSNYSRYRFKMFFHVCLLFLFGCGQNNKIEKPVIPPGLEKTRYAVYSKGQMGYIDAAGRVRIPIEYELVGEDIIDDLAPVRIGGRWGYVDLDGKMVIPPQFEKAKSFQKGRGLVQAPGGDWYVIDATGKSLFQVWGGRYTAPYFLKGMVFGGDSDSGRVWDENGIFLGTFKRHYDGKIEAQNHLVAKALLNNSESLRPFYDSQTRFYGYKDKWGTTKIQPQFSSAFEFFEGVAIVQEANTSRRAIIDEQANVKVDLTAAIPHLYSVGDFGVDGLAVVNSRVPRLRQSFSGYIDRTGQFAIQPTYNYGEDFEQGLAWVVSVKPLVAGYINKKGQFVWSYKIPAEMSYVLKNKISIDHIPYRYRAPIVDLQGLLND